MGTYPKLLTAARVRALDAHAIRELGVPSTLLMTNAAAHVAEAALCLLEGRNRTAAVFAGPGNNGGDGIAAALCLLKRGVPVRVFLTGDRERMTPDAREMERRLAEFGGATETWLPEDPGQNDYVNHCGVLIDAIFGFGLHAPVQGAALAAIRAMNGASAPVVAADMPSGIETDTGNVLGEAAYADVTVTFSALKPGHVLEEGAAHSGRVLVRDIGIPAAETDAVPSDMFAVTADAVRLPRRPRVSHKGDYGRVLILGGSVGYTGAPLFAAQAAVRSGAGLVFLGVPESVYPIVAAGCRETMPFPLPDVGGMLAPAAWDAIAEKLAGCDVCLVGPGLGRSPETEALVLRLLRESPVPLILDADGINALAGHINELDEANVPVFLTPHAGEFARLGGVIGADRLAAARGFAEAHRCTLVLKGHRTVTALPDGRVYVNTGGNPGMARGGTGDVLAGVLAAFLGQKLPVWDGVFVHSAAGDLAAAELGEYGMTPSDLLDRLPAVLKNHSEALR